MAKKIKDSVDKLDKTIQFLTVKKNLIIEKGLNSKDPEELMTANSMVAKLSDIQNREESDKKSFVFDPQQFYHNAFGYKDKPYQMSYDMMKKIPRAIPIINAIIRTRINQVASFAEAQKDKYSTGFIIRKKRKFFSFNDQPTEKEDYNKIEKITEFVLNCGQNGSWENDDFDSFTRKYIRDSLIFDQATFEVVRDRAGLPYEFFATDASTYRIADSYDDDEYNNNREYQQKQSDRKQVKGYYPSYVQIDKGTVLNEFYPWELSFGIRNPVTDIYSNGYGYSEMEETVGLITAMLWSDQYNTNFFRQGSAPKGFFKMKNQPSALINGGNQNVLQQFRQQWIASVSGVQNSWKTPVFDADVDWIPMQTNNKDMEFARWQEYLIKLTTAVWTIDPAEINFPMGGASDQKPMFESGNEGKLKHSKDKGLYPIIKFYQQRLNKHLISRFDNTYELVFMGLEAQSVLEELEMDLKKLQGFVTINEIRERWGFKKIEGGDVIASGIYMQNIMQMKQEAMMANQSGQEQEDQQQAVEQGQEDEQNPFVKDLSEFIENNLK